jgi:formylglycine-generating enzyme required for sulfatase activity
MSEWCSDPYSFYAKTETGKELKALVGNGGQPVYVLRGGTFYSLPDAVRSAKRVKSFPGSTAFSNGFRVARTLPLPAAR